MFSVSAGYKTAVEESGRITKTTIAYDDVTVTSEDVLSYFKYSHELPMDSVSGFVGKFPTAKVNYRIIAKQSGYDFSSANRSITVTASLKVGLAFDDVLLGSFIVTNEVIDKAKDEIIIEALDSSILFDKKYALTPTYPMTVKDWVLAICAEVGVALGSTSWLNSTLVLNAEPMVEGSYRNAIQYVAEACGQFARIGRDNKLYFVSFTSSGRTIHEVFEYKVSDVYGPINSLALTRDPTNDEVIEVNQPSIDLFGETRIKVDNNPILDGDRAGLIGPIFDVLDGFEMNVASLELPGDPSFDIGDELLFVDDNSVTQTLKVTTMMFEHTGSWSGSLIAVAPSKTDIDSDYSGDVSKKIKTAEIKINKLSGEIQIIGSQVDIITEDYYDGILQGAKYTFDGTMATFLGGGLKIKNNASVDVFYADVDGNLVLKGTLNAGAVIGSTITGGTINGSTIITDQDMEVGRILRMMKVVPTTTTELVQMRLGKYGLQFGDDLDGSGYPYAYMTAYDRSYLAGLPNPSFGFTMKVQQEIALYAGSLSYNDKSVVTIESGTFTPRIYGTTVAGTGTYTHQRGTYRLMGDVVYFEIYIKWTAHNGTGSMRLDGLPYAVSSEYSNMFFPVFLHRQGIALSAGYEAQAYLSPGQSYLIFTQVYTSDFSNLGMDSAGEWVISGFYWKA